MAASSLSFLFRSLIGAGAVTAATIWAVRTFAEHSSGSGTQPIATQWGFVADRVMGGLSTGSVEPAHIDGRDAMQLRGNVSLENDGGFIQMATDLGPEGALLDATPFTGIEIDVFGNDETYELRLRTDDLTRPWQSYRHVFTAEPVWLTLRIPFAELEPYRTDAPFDPARLRRLGVVAVGRAFEAEVAVAGLRLYRTR